MSTRLPILGNELAARGPIALDSVAVAEARRLWKAFRIARGMTGAAPFTADARSNAKLALSGIATRGLTLAPAGASGIANVCPNATRSCTAGCVVAYAGRGPIPSVLAGRIARTAFLYRYPEAAVALIARELRAEAAKAPGGVLVRLNVGSDLPWESIAPDLFSIEGLRFYDYTKVPGRVSGGPIAGYRLVFSHSEAAHSEAVARRYLSAGGSVAVVFKVAKGRPLPSTWWGAPVIDGDATDDRTADPEGVVVGLRVKGRGRGQEAGPRRFVQLPPALAIAGR